MKLNNNLQQAITNLSLILLGIGISTGTNYLLNPPHTNARDSDQQLVVTQSDHPKLITPVDKYNFVTKVVDASDSSVVRINASRHLSSQPISQNLPPALRHLVPPNSDKVEQGTGSGFIVSSDGLILTNAHVINKADKVTVTLKDGRAFAGKVIGSDTLTDVAVVKIDSEDLPIVTLGDSNQLKIGEWAIAIGNPLGLDSTVTTGIISATGRNSNQIGVSDRRVNFIQTDAAINPGNSGGPLLNSQGQVIGINTAIIQNAQGIGFAIPINQAKNIAEELIAHGKVEHSFIGIQMASLTPEIKAKIQQNKQINKGVIILQVLPNSPAQTAGLKPGDIITQIEGKTVAEAIEVQQLVEKAAVGDNLSIQIIRQDKNIDLDVSVGILPVG